MKRHTWGRAALFGVTVTAALAALALGAGPGGKHPPPGAPPAPSAIPSGGGHPPPHPPAAARPGMVPQAHPAARPAPPRPAVASPLPAPAPAARPRPSLVARPAAPPPAAVVRPAPPVAAHPSPLPAGEAHVTAAASLVRRPAAGPAHVTAVNRTTTVVNRPTTVVNRNTNITNTTINRTNIRQVNVNRNVSSNQTTVINRGGPGYGGWGVARSAYVGWGSDGGWHGRYQYLHDDWYQGGWGYWRDRPARGFVAGVAFGWLTSLGRDVTYQNPYYTPPTTVVVTQAFDYSRPISVPEPAYDPAPADVPYEPPPEGPDQGAPPPLPPDSGDQAAPPPLPDRPDEQAAPPPADSAGRPGDADDPEAQEVAKKTFDDARAAFRNGDYPQAQDLVEQALRNVPGDATMHEFRALTLFAQGQYRDAAGAVYAVLSAGPGWNWDTLKTLYPDTQTYTAQLRDLENYQRKHPDAPEASFLLAYQYLTLGSTDAAVKMLRQTVSVNPKDELSAQLVKMLTQHQDADDRPAPLP